MTLTRADKWFGAALLVGVAFFCVVSVRFLTTWPAFWYDEAVAVEISHNFADTGVLNVSVAPDQFSPYAMMIGANGYPLTAPLAGLIKVIGFSLSLARAYMLAWCLALIAALYLFVRRFFNASEAAAACLLVLSFSSFFANGRTVTGEIPGFFFLLLGLWLLLDQKPLYAGLLLGLAATTKPSIYLLLCVPVAVDFFLYSSQKIKDLALAALGYALPIVVWFCLVVPWPLPAGFFQTLITYYKNPFGSASILGNIISNALHAPLNSTLVYFASLAAAGILGFYYAPKESLVVKRIYVFFTIVAALSLFYFLRSPGWLRYLLPLELCVLILLPHLLNRILEHFTFPKITFALCVGVLILFQSYILFFHSNIDSTSLPETVSAYINEHLNGGTIGIINAPTIAALVPRGQMYQYISMAGIPNHGVDALSLPAAQLPRYIVVSSDYVNLIDGYESVLAKQYVQVMPDSGGYLIYERK